MTNETNVSNDQSEALPAAARACGCAACRCGDGCVCAQPGVAPCEACEDAGCGCGA